MLDTWIAARRPLVVRRHDPDATGHDICLGLALPLAQGRRRIGFVIDRAAVARIDDALPLDDAIAAAPAAWHAGLDDLLNRGRTLSTEFRVYGSLAWQHASGEPCLTDASDIDLIWTARDPAHIDAVLALLIDIERRHGLRLDGEALLDDGGSAVAWRELLGRPGRVLVKSHAGVSLRPSPRVESIADAAIASLEAELALAPKPGLVCPADRGSHRDMDAATMRLGIAALRPGFGAMVHAATHGGSFADLRAIGVDAEAAMLRATGGINTHRGAIFNLGLLASAAAVCRVQGVRITGASLRSVIVDRWRTGILAATAPFSHGLAMARLHGAGGARREAAEGFPTVFELLWPTLVAAGARGCDARGARLQVLMTSMARLVDTNLLHRGGVAGLAFAQEAARDWLRDGDVDRLTAIGKAFVARNLSPGGSADLLAATIFVDRIGDPC